MTGWSSFLSYMREREQHNREEAGTTRRQDWEPIMNYPPAIDLFSTAAALLSEDGENPEYDRAIVELTTDLLGLPEKGRPNVANTLRQTANKKKRGDRNDDAG